MTLLRFALGLVTTVFLLVPVVAQNLDADLQRATQKAMVSGDLKAAIEEYTQIVARAGSNRAVAAKALLQMAEAYQKLGDAAGVRRTYARLASEFGDQRDSAATARARLGTVEPAPSTTRVWGDDGQPGAPVDSRSAPSPDGRLLSFTDWLTGDLAVRDLASGATRRLTRHPDNFAAGYAAETLFSADGRQIAFTQIGPSGNSTPTLRVVNVDGSKGRLVHTNPDIDYIKPVGWSPDGGRILAVVNTRGRSVKISIVSADTGAETVLRTLPWGSLGSVRMSPDGRQIAYDVRQDDTGPARNIVLLAADASRAVTVIESATADRVVDWSPDGKRLLFTSFRAGSASLLSVRIVDGRADGGPTMIRPNVGWMRPLGVTRAGSLFYSLSVGTSEVYRTKWDEAGGRPVGPPATPAGRRLLGGNFSPVWSPDGTRLVYVTRSENADVPTITLIAAANGDERQVPVPELRTIQGLNAWSPDGRSVLVLGHDQKSRRGAYSVDIETGGVRGLVYDEPGGQMFGVHWLPNGTDLLFFRRSDVPERQHEIVVRNVESGTERPFFRHGDEFSQTYLSPDGRLLAIRTDAGIRVVPLAGGAPVELARAEPPVEYRIAGWTADSRHVLITAARTIAPGREEFQLWRAPAGGGSLVAVPGIDPSARVITFHPNGQEVAFHVARGGSEIWKMDGWQ